MNLLSSVNDFLWNFPLLFLLMGTHLYFTMKLRFPQRHILRAIRLSVTPEEKKQGKRAGEEASSGISCFGALATTLAATLGTGNIIGVSTAVALGGPGAVFWCWLTGILGMATAYAECYLSMLFREKNKERDFVGGPMYVLKNGVGSKKLAVFYALCTIAAAFGVGCTTQANSLTQTTSAQWGIPAQPVGFLAALVVGLVIIGGIKSIGKVCMSIVPLLGIIYIAGCLILLGLNRDVMSDTIGVILDHAFKPGAVLGGVAGFSLMQAARYGIARGLFTNEAGIGTAAIAAASSGTQNPVRQAYVSMTAVFWDTVVMCLLTGLVIVSNMIKHPASVVGVKETGLANAAFTYLPVGGSVFLTISLAAFAITTLIGWSYFGEKAVEFLFGSRGIFFYKVFYIVMIYIGAVIPLNLVWECTDLINAIMVFPNLIALFLLRERITVVNRG